MFFQHATTYNTFFKFYIYNIINQAREGGMEKNNRKEEEEEIVMLDRIGLMRKSVEKETKMDLTALKNVGSLTAEMIKSNIENPIGAVTIPVAVAGPLLVKADENQVKQYPFVDGKRYIPMATTEGALVASLNRGCKAITAAGGAIVSILGKGINRCPSFECQTVADALILAEWVKKCHYDENLLQARVRKVSRIALIKEVSYHLHGKMVIFNFLFDSGDAAGQNMSTVASEAIRKYIHENSPVPIVYSIIESGLSCDKAQTSSRFHPSSVRGIRCVATVDLPESVITSVLKVDPAKILKTWNDMAKASYSMSGRIDNAANTSNVIAGIFVATGQDIASAGECSVANLTLQSNNRDGITAMMFMPNLLVGSVGGGTHLPYARAALGLICKPIEIGTPANSKFSVFDLARSIAAACLALDLSTIASVAADTFVSAHEKLGRNRPAREMLQDLRMENLGDVKISGEMTISALEAKLVRNESPLRLADEKHVFRFVKMLTNSQPRVVATLSSHFPSVQKWMESRAVFFPDNHVTFSSETQHTVELAPERELLLGDSLIEEFDQVKDLDEDDWGTKEQVQVIRDLLVKFSKGCDANPLISPMGRALLKSFIINMMKNRIDVIRFYQLNRQAIKNRGKYTRNGPLIVTGLPRSGTTLLQRLLSLDPNSRSPFTFEMEAPLPPLVAGETAEKNPRIHSSITNINDMKRQALGFFEKFNESHLWDAMEKEESFIYMLGHNGINVMNFPLAGKELMVDLAKTDLTAIYKYEHRFFEMLDAFRPPKSHWVVKAPNYATAFAGIFGEYPNAKVVVTHRNPVTTLPSLCRMMESWCLPFYSDGMFDKREFTDALLSYWRNCATEPARFRATAAGKKLEESNQIIDCVYETLFNDPIGTVKAIYQRFGYVFTSEFESAMMEWLRENPQGKYGRHKYSLEEYGMTREAIEAEYHEYITKFWKKEGINTGGKVKLVVPAKATSKM